MRAVPEVHIVWDRLIVFAFHPPFHKLDIDFHVKWYHWRGCLRKCIPCISSKGQQTFTCGNTPIYTTRWLGNAGCIRLSQCHRFSIPFTSIASASGFIDRLTRYRVFFHAIIPNKGENRCTLRAWHGFTEHILRLILVVLDPFGSFPFNEIQALLQLCPCQGYDDLRSQRSVLQCVLN